MWASSRKTCSPKVAVRSATSSVDPHERDCLEHFLKLESAMQSSPFPCWVSLMALGVWLCEQNTCLANMDIRVPSTNYTSEFHPQTTLSTVACTQGGVSDLHSRPMGRSISKWAPGQWEGLSQGNSWHSWGWHSRLPSSLCRYTYLNMCTSVQAFFFLKKRCVQLHGL